MLPITQNSDTAVPSPYKLGVTSEILGVGKRHCRLLHRPVGRWLNRIGRSIDVTHYPKFGYGSAVSLQIRGYIRNFGGRETALPSPLKSAVAKV